MARRGAANRYPMNTSVECIPVRGKRRFFLLQVKCVVLARALGIERGSLVVMEVHSSLHSAFRIRYATRIP
jgi:hypothetical protein